MKITTQNIFTGVRTTISIPVPRPRRRYVNRRYPTPESEDQNKWIIQWGRSDGRGGHSFETDSDMGTYPTKKEATAAKRRMDAEA